MPGTRCVFISCVGVFCEVPACVFGSFFFNCVVCLFAINGQAFFIYSGRVYCQLQTSQPFPKLLAVGSQTPQEDDIELLISLPQFPKVLG